MSKNKDDKASIDKEKAIQLIKNLISHCNSILSLKYMHSHEKVAILYKNHVVELHGGDDKHIKFLEYSVPLTRSEYKDLYFLFMCEVKKRKEDYTSKKFDELESLLGPKDSDLD